MTFLSVTVSDDFWKPATRDHLEYAVLDAGPIRMQYPQEEGKRWQEVAHMQGLARTARTFTKEKHPAFQKLREERAELLREKRKEAKENLVLEDEIITENDEKKENLVLRNEIKTENDELELDPWDDDSIDPFIPSENEDDEPFNPIKAMMKLVQQEIGEGKDFMKHLKSLNVDLEDLGLDKLWQPESLPEPLPEGRDEL